VPLFVLCWYVLMIKPSIRLALAAAVLLLLNQLCENYYFLYCLFAAVLMIVWRAVASHDAFFLIRRAYRIPLLTFCYIALLLTGPLLIGLLYLNRTDPLTEFHPADLFALDLPALIIPGGHWRFSGLTAGYWSQLPGNI